MMQTVDRARLERVAGAARESERLRKNDNLHAMEDPIHRLLNATEPGTYVQPHRHATPANTETLCLLTGRGAILTFEDDGSVRECLVLAPDGDCRVVEIPAGEWHTLVALESGTVWFEVKAGPYCPPPPADVASFAPAPDTPEAAGYLERLRERATS